MNKYMDEAEKLVKENLIDNSGGPFGAVVVKSGVIIGRGSNNVIRDNDPTAHAEIMAIRDACKNIKSFDLTGCSIYTTCYPCPMCLSAIIWSNIKKVYYGNTKEDAANIGFRDEFIYEYIDKLAKGIDDGTLKLKNIDRNRTIKEFEEYMNKEDKVMY